MRVDPRRWEFGSFFHDVELPELDVRASLPWANHAHSYWASGRGALLRGLEGLEHKGELGRVWMPSFFCPAVVEAVRCAGYRVEAYPDLPTGDPAESIQIAPERGDAILATNHFGARAPRRVGSAERFYLVEDHSHDPTGAWAASSGADLCFASLRKSLPVVDGAVVWSPVGHGVSVAEELSDARRRARRNGQAAMEAKGEYLRGGNVDKDAFLAALRGAEAELAGAGPMGVCAETQTRIEAFLRSTWSDRRRSNWLRFTSHLNAVGGLEVLSGNEGGPPFSLWLLFESPRLRDAVRGALVRGGVYPAILWDLGESGWDGASPEAALLSRRSLSLPVDGRYSVDDVDEVSARLIGALEEHR